MSQTVRGWANPTVLATVAAEKMAKPWCSNPTDFDYVGDFLGEYDFLSDYDFRFVGGKCAKVCSEATVTSGQPCFHPPETWMREGIDNLLLVTSVRDTLYEANGTSISEAYLLPFADYLSVAFKLSYEELDRTIFKLGHDARKPTGVVFTSDGFLQPTKFMSSCGTLIKEVPAGEDLTLSVAELFALVCNEGYLDEIQARAGKNLQNGAKHPLGALGRITGADITIGITVDAFTNSATVTGRLTTNAFVGGSRNEYVVRDGRRVFRDRQYNGVRIQFLGDGVQRVFDVNNVILNVSALVVYLSLPIIFIKFFAVYCLGHLSTIYYRVVYAKFNIAKECGATATRLMGSAQQFHQLEDVTDADGDGVHGDTGISRKVMKAYMRDVMQYRGNVLDDAEMQQFVELAFNEVDDEDHSKAEPGTYLSTLKAMAIDYFDIDASKGHDMTARDSTEIDCINIDEFNNAFHSAFPIAFDSVVKLFDKDRKQYILERIFTPAKLKEAISRAKLLELKKRDRFLDAYSGDADASKDKPTTDSPIGYGLSDKHQEDSEQDTKGGEKDALRRSGRGDIRADVRAEQYVDWR